MSISREIHFISTSAIQQLELIGEKIANLQDEELKNQLTSLMKQLNALEEANKQSDKLITPEFALKEPDEQASVNEKIAYEISKNFPLEQSKLRWQALAQSLTMAGTFLQDTNQTKEVVKKEIVLLTDTVAYLTKGINDPDFFSKDLPQCEKSEYKPLEDRIKTHIETCSQNKEKAMYWAAVLDITSFLAGSALMVTGAILVGTGVAAPAGLALIFIGLGVIIGGKFAGGYLQTKSHEQNELVGKKVQETLQSVHGMYAKPKSDEEKTIKLDDASEDNSKKI